MTTQYTPTLKLALPVTGELSGTWGDTVNDNITSMIEQAIAGLSTINTWTGNAHTLTTANGTTSESRCAMLVAATGTGGTAITGAGEIICPAAAKLYVLQNNTSYAVTLKTSAGTGVAVAAGDTAFLFCDATNVNSCVTTIVNGNITGNLTVGGNATIKGNTTLGDATSDTITATARFNTGLIPSADNTYDLGSAANSWKDLFIDGTATMALVAISGGTINGVSIGGTTAATIINVDNLRLDGNTISSTDTNGNIVIAPNGTGDVQLDADTVRVGDAAAAATLTSNGAGALTVTTGGAADLTLSTNSGTTSGTVVIANGVNGNITLTPDGTGDVILSADRVQIGDSNTDTTLTTNGTGSLNLTTNNGSNSGTIQIAQGVNGNITLTPNGTGSVSVPKLVWSNGTATRVPYLTTGGQFTDSANLTFSGTDLTVSGAVNAGSIAATTLDLTNLEVTNIKAKDGTAAMTIADTTGAVTVSSNFSTQGNTTLGNAAADNVTVTGTVTSNLIFTDNTYDIGASAATRPRSLFLGTNLTVGSLTSTRVPYASTAGLLVDSANLTFNGTTLTAGGLTTTGTTSTGVLSVTGNTTLGDAAADTVTVTGTITSNLLFTDATYDIGASGATRPRDLFLSRNLTVGGTLTLAGGVNLNGNVTVGDSSADTLTINSTITSNLIFTDNTYDIGASGATRPRTGYFGTSIFTPLLDATNVEVSNIKALDGTAAITIASSTGAVAVSTNVTLGDATTDTVTVNGYMGIGGAGASSRGLQIANAALTGTTQFGAVSGITSTSSATTATVGYYSGISTAASAYTSAAVRGFWADDCVKGAGSTITNQHGVYVGDQTQGTNNYGITSLVSSGTNKFNIYASGTAQNYFAGNVGFGNQAPTNPITVAGTGNATYSSAKGLVVDYVGSSTSVIVPIGFSWASSISTQNPYWGMGFIPTSYAGGTGELGFYVGAVEKGRFNAGGLCVGATSTLYTSRLTVAYNPTSTNGPIIVDNRSFGVNRGGAQWFGGQYNTAGDYRPWSGTVGAKENSTDGNSAGFLAFYVNKNAADAVEAARITSSNTFLLGTTTDYGGMLTVIPRNGNPTTASSSLNQIQIGEASENSAYRLNLGYTFISGGYKGNIQAMAGGVGGILAINADGGNVGIGTNTPAYLLDVFSSSAAAVNTIARFYNAFVTGNTDIYVNNAGTGGDLLMTRRANGDFWLYQSGAFPIRLYTQATQRFSVDASGRIGFGSTGTSSDRLVDMSFSSAVTIGVTQFGLVLNPTYPTTPTTNIYNIYSGPNLTAGTTVTNVYGHYLEAIGAPGSTITNRWGIYQAGTSDNNYFAGRVSIGTSANGAYTKVNTLSGENVVAYRVYDENHDASSSTFIYPITAYYARRDNNQRFSNPIVTDATNGAGATAVIAFTDRPGTGGYPTYVRTSDILFYTATNDGNGGIDANPRLTMQIYAEGTIQFNRYGAGTLSTNASGVVSASDGRMKTKTRDLTEGLSKIRALAKTTMYYLWNENTPMRSEHEEIGWAAQDVAAVIPEASPDPGQDKFRNYHDRAVIAYMAKAIDELAAQIESLKTA